MNQLFETGSKIIKILKAGGYEGFFVGGAVRDYIMNRDIHDVDITTNADPADVESVFQHTIDVGKEHGTIIVLFEGVPFEVTTYRADNIITSLKDSDEENFSLLLNEDLKHRDFTMNAMAMNENYELYDPFGGRKSIQKRTIQTVGSAAERFQEDPLRMLRALRFMSTLDFNLHVSVIDEVNIHRKYLSDVAVERIIIELRKMYTGAQIDNAKVILNETKLIQYIPFFNSCSNTLCETTAHDILDEFILQIYHQPQLIEELHLLKLSNNDKSVIKNTLGLIKDLNQINEPVKIAFHYNLNILERLKTINEKNEILNSLSMLKLSTAIEKSFSLPIRSRKDLAVNGRILMQHFKLKGGPWLKEILSYLEDAVLLNEITNDQDEILEWVVKHVIIENGHIKTIK